MQRLLPHVQPHSLQQEARLLAAEQKQHRVLPLHHASLTPAALGLAAAGCCLHLPG